MIQVGPTLRIPSARILWIAFSLVNLWLFWLAITGPFTPLTDVIGEYRSAVDIWFSGNAANRPGLGKTWGYPPLAIVPMMISMMFSSAWVAQTWLIMVITLNAWLFYELLRIKSPWSRVAAVWWLAFLALSGPVSLGRLESVSIPLVTVGLLWLARRPRVATLILVIASWLKFWPAALLVTVVTTLRRRREAIVVAIGSSIILIAGFIVVGGSLANIFSFIYTPEKRGLQIESSFAWFWMNRVTSGDKALSIAGNPVSGALEISGTGSNGDLINATLTFIDWAVVVVFIALIALAIRAVSRGATFAQVAPYLALGLVVNYALFNKVGSPQYYLWLAAPIIFGLVALGRKFLLPAVLALMMAAITQIIYPFGYEFLFYSSGMSLLLLVRGLCLAVLIGFVVWTLTLVSVNVRLTRDSVVEPSGFDLNVEVFGDGLNNSEAIGKDK